MSVNDNNNELRKVRRFTIARKMFLFVFATVLLTAASVCIISYIINVQQIDSYYKRLADNTAHNYAYMVDSEFIDMLDDELRSAEYQEVRQSAENNSDYQLINEYLWSKGLGSQLETERAELIHYVQNMSDIHRIYLVSWDEAEGQPAGTGAEDFIIIDSEAMSYQSMGSYFNRPSEFAGVDPFEENAPVITDGEHGWICTAFAPVFDRYGNFVCLVVCELVMESVMEQRMLNLMYTAAGAGICIAFVLVIAFIYINSIVVTPLKKLTHEMRKFDPGGPTDPETAEIINVDIKGHDEIREIYDELRSMQIRIIDYINEVTDITTAKEIAERNAYRDGLTGTGNKASYEQKMKELDEAIVSGIAEFAIVMVDVNDLKSTNDRYGHSAGDIYIKGCCRIICEVFKHSPVYRIGGDEFVAVLIGDDYVNRDSKILELHETYDRCRSDMSVKPWQRYSAALGVAEYTDGDRDADAVFNRADELMYINKMQIKGGGQK